MEKTHRCFFPPSSDDIAVVTNLVNQNNRHLTTGSISITNVAISGNKKEKNCKFWKRRFPNFSLFWVNFSDLKQLLHGHRVR